MPKKASNDSNFICFIGVSSKDKPGILNLNGKNLREKYLKTLDEAIVIASLIFKPYHLNGNEKHGVSICLHNMLVLPQAGSDKIKSVDKRLSPKQNFADSFSGDNENTQAIV